MSIKYTEWEEVVSLLEEKHYNIKKDKLVHTSYDVFGKNMDILSDKELCNVQYIKEDGKECIKFYYDDREIYMTNESYLLIFGETNESFVEFFYCDYDQENIGYSFADKKGNIYNMETVFCINKSSIITPHLPIPGKYYFNIESYKELCMLGKPVVTLKPNKSCIDLVPKLIFIPSKYKE